jgi:hypothetical protein
LAFGLAGYLELTEWVDRAIREEKSGAIPAELAPILERLNIAPEAWLECVQNYNKNHTVVGTRKASNRFSQNGEKNWFCLSRF